MGRYSFHNWQRIKGGALILFLFFGNKGDTVKQVLESKQPGVCPIGIGDVFDRLCAKASLIFFVHVTWYQYGLKQGAVWSKIFLNRVPC